jgi:hypothetical protein
VDFVALLLVAAEERKGRVAANADQRGKGGGQGDAWRKQVAVIVVVKKIQSLRQHEGKSKNASVRHAAKTNYNSWLKFYSC